MSESKRRPMPPARSPLHPPQRPERQAPPSRPAAAPASSHILWVAAGVVLAIVGVLCLVLVGLVGMNFLGSENTGANVEITQNNIPVEDLDEPDPNPLEKKEPPVEPIPDPVIPAPEHVEPDPVEPPSPPVEDSGEPSPKTHQPLEDVRQRNLRLALPTQENSAALELTKVYVDSPAQCELKLLGAECFASAEGSYHLEMKDVGDAQRDWKLLLKPAAGVGSGLHIGTFMLQQQLLSFAWQPIKGAPRSFAFQYCLLQIKAGGEALHCRLADPVESALPPFTFAAGRASIKIPFPHLLACDAEHLRLKVAVRQFAEQTFDPGDTLKLKESAKLTILDAGISDENGPAPVTLEFQLHKKTVEPELAVSCFANVPKYELAVPMPPKPAKVDVRYKHKLADLKGASPSPKKVLDDIIKPKASAEKLKLVSEARVANAQQAALNNPNNFALQQAWQLESMNLARIKDYLAELQHVEDAANAWQSWIDAMQTLQTSLSGEAGVQIELFVEIEGEVVTLYRSQ